MTVRMSDDQTDRVKSKAISNIRLTYAQRNHLRVALKSYEEALRLAENWLAKDEEVGFLYARRLKISDEKRQLAVQQIKQSLADVQKLSEALQYQPREEDAGRMITAALSVAWETLIDAESKGLKGYGKIDPNVAEVIDPAFEHLAEMAMQLADLFKT
jgi:hypothetical protein